MTKVQVKKEHKFLGHKSSIYRVEESSDGKYFFSCGGDGFVVVWNIEDPDNGEVVAKVPNSVYCIGYSEDDDLLYVGHNYDGLHVIDWRNKKEVGSLKLTDGEIFDIKRWKEFIFVATGDGEIIKINAKTLEVDSRVKLSDKNCRTLTFRSDVDEMAVGFSDNCIRIMNPNTLEVLFVMEEHSKSVFSLVYSSDNKLLLSGSMDAHLMIWNVEEGYTLQQDIVAHMYAINAIAYSPDDSHFVTASMDKTIKVWDAKTFQLLKVIDKVRHEGHLTSVNSIFWSSLNGRVISCSDDRSISIWDIKFESL